MRIKLLSALLGVFSWIPPRFAHAIATPLAFMIWHLSRRKRHVTGINLQVAYPDLEDQARDKLAMASLVHYVRGILEAGMLWHWSAEKMMASLIDVQGLEHLQEARAHGRGVIIAGPHWGAWELISTFVQQEIDGAILYKPSKHEDFEAELLRKRAQTGVQYAPTTPAGLKRIYRHLSAGRAVGYVCDQEPSTGMGRWVPFFGIPALTAILIPRLVQKTGCRVVFSVAERRKDGRYRVHFLPVDPALYSADIDTSLTALNRGIEACIAIDPEQYLWAYKRFRHGPDYAKGIY
jgi:KDO2-lipid IV(A) lauroyltransferase